MRVSYLLRMTKYKKYFYAYKKNVPRPVFGEVRLGASVTYTVTLVQKQLRLYVVLYVVYNRTT